MPESGKATFGVITPSGWEPLKRLGFLGRKARTKTGVVHTGECPLNGEIEAESRAQEEAVRGN